MLELISQHGDQPNSAALSAAHALLVDIEKWKAMCLKERMGNAAKNSPKEVWEAFRLTFPLTTTQLTYSVGFADGGLVHPFLRVPFTGWPATLPQSTP